MVFPVHANQPALATDGCGVVDAALNGVSVADNYRKATGTLNGLVESFNVVAKKGGAEEQVFGGVAGDGHFREGNNVGAGIASAGHKLEDPFNIAREISNHGIHLSQGYSKGAHFSPTG